MSSEGEDLVPEVALDDQLWLAGAACPIGYTVISEAELTSLQKENERLRTGNSDLRHLNTALRARLDNIEKEQK